MTRVELENRIRKAVEEYIAGEETYDDNALLLVDSEEWNVNVTDGEDVEQEQESTDSYEVMDFIRMSSAEPGKWEVDGDVVESVAAEYIK